jgi:putative membrane protein
LTYHRGVYYIIHGDYDGRGQKGCEEKGVPILGGYQMMSGGQGFMGGGFMWIFWIAIIVGIIFLVRWVVQQSRPGEGKLEESSLELLKKRYARGEIDRNEFERKKKDLLS